MKKITSFLFSMKFAMIILVLFVLVCIAGSVIPQGEIEAVYRSSYPSAYHFILAIGLDDVFHIWWFATLTAILCLNLLGCNLVHFPQLMRRMRSTSYRNAKFGNSDEGLPFSGSLEELYRDMGFRRTEVLESGTHYAIRNKIGIWGAWLTHLGILIIIVGFALGQMYTAKYAVYGVPGEEKAIGDTPYMLHIDDFSIILRPDDTVEQYTASLTLTDMRTGESWSGQSSVNHPLDLQGYRLYQNSTGWAADVIIYKGEELLQTQTLCAGEYLTVKDMPELMVYFRAFYPDYTMDAGGMPATASDRIDNPGYLYMLYYNEQMLGMNVLQQDESITVSDYTILFTNPRSYTLIQIKHDPYTWLAGIGGGVLLIALFIAFYLRTEELWAVPMEDGSYMLYGKSRKGSLLYQDRLREKIGKHRSEVSK